jgi:hypothetical protein
MSSEAFLVLDLTGRILWADRAAHRMAGVPAGTLVGRNYLEFCPPETHADLLRLQARKIRGATVKFLMRLPGRVIEVTSGPVEVEGRTYLFVVGREVGGSPAGDVGVVGRTVVARALDARPGPLDVGQCLMGALRAEAARLRGRVRLHLAPDLPAIRGRPALVQLLLRCLLLAFVRSAGSVPVRLGRSRRRVWVELGPPPKGRRLPDRELALCRPLVARAGGVLRRGAGRRVRVFFRPA